jgi:hypothetical protein
VTNTGGAEKNVTIRHQKAKAALTQCHRVWNAKEISTASKLKNFRSNVKSVLLYEWETRKVTKKINYMQPANV